MESGIQTRSRRSAENRDKCINVLPPKRNLRSSSSPGLKPLQDVRHGQNDHCGTEQCSRNSEMGLKPPIGNNRRSRTPKRSASPYEEKQPVKKRISDRKSKRRSSFVRGRITDPGRGLLLNISSDLTKVVPCDVSPEERLDRIACSAVEYTLAKIQVECPSHDGIQQLIFKVRDASEDFISSIRAEGLFSRAVQKRTKSASSEGTPMDHALERATTECKVLRDEMEKWEKLLEDGKQAVEEAKVEASEIELHPITTPPAGISENDLEVLNNRPDYDALLSNIQTHRNDILLYTEELGNGVAIIKNFMTHAEDLLKARVNAIEKETFAGLEGIDDPKNMIAKLIDPSS